MTISSASPLNVGNPEKSAQLISDPAAAAAVADLKRRWAAIGAAADHPLVEFFALKKPRRKRQKTDYYVLFGILAFIVLLVGMRFFHIAPRTIFGPLYVVFMLTVAIAATVRQKYILAKNSNLSTPLQMITDAGDVGQWEQIWLAPLDFRDLVGVCLGYAYWRACSRRKWPWRWIFRGLLFAIFAGLIGLFFYDRYTYVLVITFFGYPVHGVIMAICIGLFFVAAHRLLSHPALILIQYMGAIQNMILNRQRSWFSGYKSLHFQLPMISIGVAIPLSFTFVIIAMRETGASFIPFEAALLVWAAGMTELFRRLSRKDMDRMFAEFVDREGPEFHKLICQRIGREE